MIVRGGRRSFKETYGFFRVSTLVDVIVIYGKKGFGGMGVCNN
jgi:hypothetical protein